MQEWVDERLRLSSNLTVVDEPDEATADVVDQNHHNLNQCSSKCVQMVHDERSDAVALMLWDLALSASDGGDVERVHHVAMDVEME